MTFSKELYKRERLFLRVSVYEPGTIDVNKMLTIIERWNKTCLNQETSGQVRFKKFLFYINFEIYFDPDHLQIRYGYLYNKCSTRARICKKSSFCMVFYEA